MRKPPATFSQQVWLIYGAGGVPGFWVGVGTTVTRAVVLGATNLGTYSNTKEALLEVRERNRLCHGTV